MPTGKKGRSAEDFQREHDQSYIVPERIKKGLAELADSWEYEPEFLKRIGCVAAMVAPYREKFHEHVVELKAKRSSTGGRRAWAGTSKLAAKLREMASR